MKELHVTIKIRNNLLLQRRTDLKLSQIELAELLGFNHASYGLLEANNKSPLSVKKGVASWSNHAVKIAEFYDVDPSELFPEAILNLKQSTAVKIINSAEMKQLAEGLYVDQLRLTDSETPEDTHFDKETLAALHDALQTLTPREQDVINLRFGLNGEYEHTLDEIKIHVKNLFTGNSVDRERIRQIEAKALRKLRNPEKTETKRLRRMLTP